MSKITSCRKCVFLSIDTNLYYKCLAVEKVYYGMGMSNHISEPLKPDWCPLKEVSNE